MDDFDDTAAAGREPADSGRTPRRLVVGSPDDLLACVPLALGFVPTGSVVMVAVGGAGGPHARVDVPTVERVHEVAECLARPALAHGVTTVALVVYADLELAEQLAPGLLVGFARAGVQVVALVGADGERWVSLEPGSRTRLPREYDALAHRFVTEAVVDGQVVLASRAALADALAPVPEEVEQVERCLDRLLGAETPPPRAAPERLARLVRRSTALGHRPGVRELALLRLGVQAPEGRDAAWSWVRREDARAHVDLWIRVVRSCSEGRAAAPASVLAFHAWLAGDGALAWCALDRAGERGNSTSLAALVGDLLARAVSPSAWVALAPTPEQAERRGSGVRPAAGSGRLGGCGGEGASARLVASREARAAEVVDLAERRRRRGQC